MSRGHIDPAAMLVAALLRAAGRTELRVPLEELARRGPDDLVVVDDPMRDERIFRLYPGVIEGEEVPLVPAISEAPEPPEPAREF